LEAIGSQLVDNWCESMKNYAELHTFSIQ